MDEETDDDATRGRISTVDADDEDQVQAKNGKEEVDQDLMRLVQADFTVRKKRETSRTLTVFSVHSLISIIIELCRRCDHVNCHNMIAL